MMGVNCLIFAGNTEYPWKMLAAGPYRIATQLRQNGFTTQVVDLCRYKQFNSVYQAVVKKFVDKDTLWVGFSTNFMNHILGYPYRDSHAEIEFIKKTDPNIDSEVKKFIEYCRTLNPKIQFVLGGIKLYSLAYLGFVEMRGHTDQQIVDYTTSLSIGYVPDIKIIQNDEYKDFSNSKIIYTKNDVLNTYKGLSLEISRGCIFKCKFCSFALNGKTKGEWIKKTELLKEELLHNYELFGITDYVLSDDTYNDSVEKMENLYKNVFSQLPFKIRFSTYLRADLIYRYPHTAALLAESGLVDANFGLETTNWQAAKLIGKGTNPQILLDFLAKVKEDQFKNVIMSSSWILGLPTDTKQSIIDFYKWLISENNPINYNRCHPLVLRPADKQDLYLYRSDFDNTYDSVCNVDIFLDEDGKWAWKSRDSDLTYKWCMNFTNFHGDIASGTRKILRKNDRIAGRFLNSTLYTLGIDQQDLIHTPAAQVLTKHNLTQMAKEQELNYLKNLLTI